MCPSIERISGRTFVETIRIEEGRIHNLPYHNARMNRTRRDLFGAREEIDLADYIHPEPYRERTKCRVEYAREVLRVEYAPYHMRPVRSLRLVACEGIDYSYKSTDRQCLNDLFAQRAGRDDILVVRDGLLTDTSICNVALWDGTSWITPARPLLCGTTRACLLDRGLIRAGDIPAGDLSGYTRIRMFNALIGFGEQECELS
ncbi:MAG: aminotransferase class IV family protein [Parabacteroides sp.]|nr:aminotransferase class IV family protein [Parabacteroides sp.]